MAAIMAADWPWLTFSINSDRPYDGATANWHKIEQAIKSAKLPNIVSTWSTKLEQHLTAFLA